ncbi:hypothetical protein HWI79_2514 [Cryptosporidium felis]|nr:hypothetical protein HWI79_2514 [Cryptosporidium felis]
MIPWNLLTWCLFALFTSHFSSGGIFGVYARKKSGYKIDNPSLNPETNLDRSKRLREALFEPSEFGVIKSDFLLGVSPDSGQVRQIPIRGQESFDSSKKRARSVLYDENKGVQLFRPYEGVFANYNLTSFSHFISRIVEMEIEMHLTFREAGERRSLVRRREIGSSNFNGSALQGHETFVNGEFQSIGFLFVAGYFRDGNRTSRDGLLHNFIPVFQDNITLSRQNANQYYARYGITTFKDRLTATQDRSDPTTGIDLFSSSKINVDKHKLSLLYLPRNDTQLYFSVDRSGRIVLPKLHLKAIQTHQEASDEPESPSKDEGSNAKKVVIITFLLLTMFVSFLVLFYILISWYLKGIQKHS